jgi:uridine phosphorylase
MRIQESELILSENRIYHLGLHPDELANVIITVGDPNRVNEVSKYFDKVEYKISKREFVTHTGYLGKKRISVIGTGIGPDNIDIMINEVDAVKNIDFNTREIKADKTYLNIIRMGTSGALQKDIPVDSFVASSHGLGLDGLLNFYKYKKNDFQRDFISELEHFVPDLFNVCKPTIFSGSDSLMHIIAPNLIRGITLTAGGFYAPQGRKLRLDQKMKTLIDKMVQFNYKDNRFTNFEMETSSIYGLSKLMGHQALSINAIIANRAKGTFSKDPYLTIERMIKETLEKISDSRL